MTQRDIARWVESAPAAELAAFLSLAGARLLVLVGLDTEPAKVPPAPSRILSVAEAARQLGMSPRWLYDRAASLPFCRRVGRSIRVDEAGMRRWVEGRNAG